MCITPSSHTFSPHHYPILGRLLKAKTGLYLYLFALHIIQGPHILCFFTLHLAFVLFRERCHLPLHSTDLWMTVQVHLLCFWKYFLSMIFQFFPDGKQKQFFLYVSCRQYGTEIQCTDVNGLMLSKTRYIYLPTDIWYLITMTRTADTGASW